MATIADHILAGDRIFAYCPCGHDGEVDLDRVGRVIGMDAPAGLPEIGPRLRCGACGRKGDGRDRYGAAISITLLPGSTFHATPTVRPPPTRER
ncbi:hypothetical protein [Methylobrevis pamukkalensis]|uniref:Uncharacterized protein n=1 Tax=Methylobrevis pamukkalensis TaxID=1439726 RepID=A0A1E3H0N2_9HYPH|nr:hypothetical protein [Methylobrevis pamukkalensis]ODN69898.1 hypothetical protein A6302_02780 [Methylobrevis pamukkalensis]